MKTKYCFKCKKDTIHTVLKQSGFLLQCGVALVSGFSVDLKEPSLESTCCGTKV